METQTLRRYAYLSIAAALVTVTMKVGAYSLTGSVGLLSDALESLVNLAGAVMALAMLIVAARPADEEHAYGPVAYLPSAEADPADAAEDDEWRSHASSKLRDGLAALDERSRDILQSRWLTDDKATLQALAERYGVSAERIRQLEANAMKKLRSRMVLTA